MWKKATENFVGTANLHAATLIPFPQRKTMNSKHLIWFAAAHFPV
jgi:hypothetical protein